MSRLSGFEPVGPAMASRARIAHVVDGAAAFVGAVLIFPFPFARVALPLPAFVVSIVAMILAVHLVYLAVSLVVWGRTPGMFLLDLGIAPRPVGMWAALCWSSGSVAGFVPALFSVAVLDPVRGLPARWSGLSTVATVMPDGSRNP